MRDKRFFQVRKEKRARPHYLQTMVGVLNKAHTAPVQQMTLFGTSVPLYDLETLDKDFDSIFCGSLDPNGGFTHCVVVYDTVRGELANIKILFPDKNLEIIEELSLNEYIRPDFAALSNIQPVAGEADDSESRDSSHLLSLKNPGGNVAEGSAETPARLREITEQDAI